MDYYIFKKGHKVGETEDGGWIWEELTKDLAINMTKIIIKIFK